MLLIVQFCIKQLQSSRCLLDIVGCLPRPQASSYARARGKVVPAHVVSSGALGPCTLTGHASQPLFKSLGMRQVGCCAANRASLYAHIRKMMVNNGK